MSIIILGFLRTYAKIYCNNEEKIKQQNLNRKNKEREREREREREKERERET